MPSEAFEKQTENIPGSQSPHLVLLNSCVLTPWAQLYTCHFFIFYFIFFRKLNICLVWEETLQQIIKSQWWPAAGLSGRWSAHAPPWAWPTASDGAQPSAPGAGGQQSSPGTLQWAQGGKRGSKSSTCILKQVKGFNTKHRSR